MGEQRFSVVIPTLNEAQRLQQTVAAAKVALAGDTTSILVADGGSDDRTVQLARDLGCRVVETARGRGIQLKYGAEAAMETLGDDDVMVFLHADTILPPMAGQALSNHFSNPAHHIALFQARFDRQSLMLRINACFTCFETYWTSFGDQVISIRKKLYEEIGGFPEWPSFEDVKLLQMARKRTRIARIPVWVTTSARMYDAVGQTRQQLRNAWLLLRFRFGASPESFYDKYYRPLREHDRDGISLQSKKRSII